MRATACSTSSAPSPEAAATVRRTPMIAATMSSMSGVSSCWVRAEASSDSEISAWSGVRARERYAVPVRSPRTRGDACRAD